MKKKNALLQPSTSITASVAKTEFSDELVVSLIDYNSTDYSEKTSHDLNDFVCCHNPETVSWLNVDGLHNDAIVHQIGARFGLHALLIEDVLNVEERPKHPLSVARANQNAHRFDVQSHRYANHLH